MHRLTSEQRGTLMHTDARLWILDTPEHDWRLLSMLLPSPLAFCFNRKASSIRTGLRSHAACAEIQLQSVGNL